MEAAEKAKALDPAGPISDALTMLEHEIELHRRHERSQSYLRQAADSLWRQDERSLEALEKLHDEIVQARRTGDRSAESRLSAQIQDRLEEDKEALRTQEKLSEHAAGFLKTAGLFMRGRLGLVGMIGVYALDQMNPHDRLPIQLVDGTLGALKGGLIRKSLHFINAKNPGIAATGVGLGISSRTAELTLTRGTYIDGQTGSFSLAAGLSKSLRLAAEPKALVSDVIVFGAAHGLLGKANSLSHGAVDKSPLLRTMLTGTTFGLSSGAVEEILRQKQAGEAFDPVKVLEHAAVRGAIDTVAATPGGLQARAASRRLADAAGGSLILAGRKTAGESSLGKSREFVVTKGEDVLKRLLEGSSGQGGWLRVKEVLSAAGESPRLGVEKSLFVQHLDKAAPRILDRLTSADLVAFCNPALAAPLVRAKHLFPEAQGSVWLEVSPNARWIRFSAGEKPASDARFGTVLELGRQTARSLLKDKGYEDYAEALKDIPRLASLKAVRFLGEGSESVAVEIAPGPGLPEGAALKITVPEGGWNHAWGKRPRDAKILGKVHELELPGDISAYAFLQELVETRSRYEPEHVNEYLRDLSESGLEFQDPGAAPTKQVGYSKSTGELVTIDYAAVDRPGANETLQQLIGGSERVQEQYDIEDRRGSSDRDPLAEEVESAYGSSLDVSLERRRQEALAEPNLPPHVRSILQQLFQGASIEDAVILRTAELGSWSGTVMSQARQQVAETIAWAEKQKLLNRRDIPRR